MTGVADVVVTDGFTGNVALKTAEGTAKICASYIKEALSSSLLQCWVVCWHQGTQKNVQKHGSAPP